MGNRMQGLCVCFGGSDKRVNTEMGTSNKPEKTLKSHDSLHSQRSSLPSQSSFEDQSIQSNIPSTQSELSTCSETSNQSQLSLYSQYSLGSVTSLGRPQAFSKCSRSVCIRCISTLKGHSGYVFSLATAGDFLYSGSIGDDIRVWRNPELHEYCKFGNGDGAVKCILVAEDKIYSAHQDHKIRVWRRSQANPRVHKLVSTIPTVKDNLLNFLTPNTYVQVRRHKKCLWIEHVDTISGLAVDKNGFLYSASWDRTVKVWRPSDFCCIESFKAHDDAINAFLVSSDGFLYTASADSKIKVWAKSACDKKHSLVTTLEKHKSAVNALALSEDGSILYSGACDRSVVVWEREESAEHMSVAGALKGHKRAILCLACVSDMVCSGSADKTVRVWRRGGEGNIHSCLAVLEGHSGPVKSIVASVNASLGSFLVYSGGLDHDIRVWWISASQENSPLNTPELLKWNS
eukprot:Gb_26404 [translate_table: standard]